MKKNKITNEQKYKYAKYNLICWYLIIITGILTIAFSLLSLFKNISPIYAIISFILEIIFTKVREKFRNPNEKE